VLLAGYKLGDGTVLSLTPLQQHFVSLVELWQIKRDIQLAGFETEKAEAESITVTEYADRLAAVRRNNPGVLEYMTS